MAKSCSSASWLWNCCLSVQTVIERTLHGSIRAGMRSRRQCLARAEPYAWAVRAVRSEGAGEGSRNHMQSNFLKKEEL